MTSGPERKRWSCHSDISPERDYFPWSTQHCGFWASVEGGHGAWQEELDKCEGCLYKPHARMEEG